MLAKQARELGGVAKAGSGKLPKHSGLLVLAVLLFLGAASSVIDLMGTSDRERSYAERSGQRVSFAASGELEEGVLPMRKRKSDFDVEAMPEVKKLQKQATEKKTLAEAKTDPSKATPPPDIEGIKAPEAAAPKAAEAPVTSDAAPPQAPLAEPQERSIDPSLPKLQTAEGEGKLRIARSSKSLIFAPAPEISKPSKLGLMPVKTKHGSPFTVYARSYTPRDDAPMVALVITHVGFSQRAALQAVSLPAEVSMAVSPYAPDVEQTIDSLRNAGHEVWSMLPTQSADYPEVDPGPLGLLVTLGAGAITERLEQIMVKTRGAVGMIFSANDAFYQNSELLSYVIEALDEHGFKALYSDEAAPEVDGETLISAHYFLPRTLTSAALASKLGAIKQQLDAKPSSMIILVEASPHTVEAVKKFSASLTSDAVSLSPLSAFFRDFAAEKLAEEKAAEEAASKDKKAGGH